MKTHSGTYRSLIFWLLAALVYACSAEVGEPGGTGGMSTGAGGAGASGAGSGGMPTGGFTPTGGTITGAPPVSCDIGLLLRTCTSSICHASSRREGDLALDYPDPFGPAMAAELIGTSASYSGVQDAFNCPTEREIRVDPTDIENSQILHKVDGQVSCGEPMPNGDEQPVEWLPEARPRSVQCIREWLLNLVALYP